MGRGGRGKHMRERISSYVAKMATISPLIIALGSKKQNKKTQRFKAQLHKDMMISILFVVHQVVATSTCE